MANRIYRLFIFRCQISRKNLICCFAFQIIITSLYLTIVYQFLNSKQSPAPDNLFSQLSTDGVRLVMLDVNSSNSNSIFKNGVISYGIFEKDREIFLRSFAKNTAGRWTLIEIHGRDYRFMRPIKNESIPIEVITHYFMISSSSIIHIPVIFPRNNFYWIAGINNPPSNYRYLAFLNFSIPLPMAVEEFKCTIRPAFSNSSYNVCIPDNLDFYRWQLPHARFVECHYEDIVFPFKDEYNLTELIDTSIHRKLMGEVFRVSKELHVPPILIGGSLLGWYRQCNQIVESLDGDLGILVSEYNPKLFYRLFGNKEVRVSARFGVPGHYLEYRTILLKKKASYHLDIFLIYPTVDPGILEIYSYVDYIQSYTYPKRRGVCSAELFGILVFIPCNYVEFVEVYFGKDGWFPPNHVAPFKSMKKVRLLENVEADVMKYWFKRSRCQKPDPVWGCDPIPDTVINTTYYENLKDMMKKNAPAYWK